mgnify:CR=1 FL=1
MSVKVFIDGSSGTTGLRIADRLAARPEIELLSISAEGRKDVNERAKVINSADLAFLCLPDAASREVMPMMICGKVSSAAAGLLPQPVSPRTSPTQSTRLNNLFFMLFLPIRSKIHYSASSCIKRVTASWIV